MGTVTVTTATSFGAVTLASIVTPSPLPIELLSFDGKAVPMGVQLRWTTASEINNDYFEVEKMVTNGEKFATIATMKGNGTTSVTNHYDYLDRKVATGRTYYRLKQVDLDGNYKYSNVISVDFEGSFTYSVYPNPVTGNELGFEILGVHETNAVSISIFDELGRTVLSFQADVDEVSGSVEGRIPVDKLSNGLYYFRVLGSNIVSKVLIRK